MSVDKSALHKFRDKCKGTERKTLTMIINFIDPSDGHITISQQDIGEALERSRERIRQIYKKLIYKGLLRKEGAKFYLTDQWRPLSRQLI